MKIRCPVCGSDVPPTYVGSSGACYECRLASFVPKWYPKAERYEYVPQYGHSNATRKPETGVDFLDESHVRICDVLEMCGRKPKR